jgi:hypothetical protein
MIEVAALIAAGFVVTTTEFEFNAALRIDVPVRCRRYCTLG